jgi:hypothetical protein
VTFIAPLLSWTEVSFLWHVNDTPLHRIYAVVWDGVNGCPVRQGVDNVVIALAFFGLLEKYNVINIVKPLLIFKFVSICFVV